MIIAFSIQMLFFFFASFICWIILFYYGRVLIALTRESLELAGIDDELKKYDKENFNIHINKMKALNYAFGGICLLFAIFLIPITILYKKTLMQNFIINLMYFLICDVCVIIMVATIGFVIIYSEFKSRNIKKEKTDLSTSEFDNHNVT
ncbi:hypothetical protein C1645_67949 [Glomus cerebriforme]|uniref:Uncharacterized protein n=1 Tax=Glomus cerebriforme TaxID=658196 RepID=A0A397T1T3_9GLOM|nr:hypothetical protein C1645_67949 [Glomus cerebriforme]